MKKQIIRHLILAVFCLFAHLLSAQVQYEHYFNSTYQWYEYQFQAGFGGIPPCDIIQSDYYRRYYHFTGYDSLDGYYWHEVHSDIHHTISCSPGPAPIYPPTGSNGPAFRIREDSTGKIWIRYNTGAVKMMYDFNNGNLLPGDTLWMEDYNSYCPITYIDSISFSSGKRARYWCGCGSSTAPDSTVMVVEGIGLKQGFQSYVCQIGTDGFEALTCAQIDGHSIRIHPDGTCGSPAHVVVGLEDPLDQVPTFAWLPGSERVQVRNLASMEDRSWQVYDARGRLCREGELGQEVIELPGLPSGLYIFMIQGTATAAAQAWKFIR